MRGLEKFPKDIINANVAGIIKNESPETCL